jgi:hypothetical protein
MSKSYHEEKDTPHAQRHLSPKYPMTGVMGAGAGFMEIGEKR